MPSKCVTISCKILGVLSFIGSIYNVWNNVQILLQPQDVNEIQEVFGIGRSSAENFIAADYYTSILLIVTTIIGCVIYGLCLFGVFKENEKHIKPALIWIPISMIVAIICVAPMAYYIGIYGIIAAFLVLGFEIVIQFTFVFLLYKFRKEIMEETEERTNSLPLYGKK